MPLTPTDAFEQSAAHKPIIQRQIDATDAEIDRLVYVLYNLSEEEIRIIESSDEPQGRREKGATDGG